MCLSGKGYAVLPGDAEWKNISKYFIIPVSIRQIILGDIHKGQTSCGYGVPLYTYEGERENHQNWSEKVGSEGINEYKLINNMISLGGLPTALAIIGNGA